MTNRSTGGSGANNPISVFSGSLLLLGLFVGVPVWYVSGTDFSKVLAVSLALATLLAMQAATDVRRYEAFYATMFFGLIVAALVWLVLDTGFFAVLVASFLLGMLLRLVGVGEQEERIHRPPSEDGGGGRIVPLQPHDLRVMPYKDYLQTPHWKRKREDKVRAAGHRCQLCNRGSVTLNVHHRTYERLGEELDEDLTVLCRDCHNTFHEHRRLVR
ncbi:MAG: hypothetical protein H0X57_00945 [Rubrobacter sp.]|nr:hypothetical protein [Rubrobacter sp.]